MDDEELKDKLEAELDWCEETNRCWEDRND